MIVLDVPDKNDSVSRFTLAGKDYNVRFTYNPSEDSWYFSVLSMTMETIIGMIKIVPMIDLLWQHVSKDLPDGVFGCWTRLDRVGKNDFVEGKALFGFISKDEVSA